MKQRVYRPLGLTLAILSGIILFGVWPLVKFYLAYRLNFAAEQDSLLIAWGAESLPLDWLTYLVGALGVLVIITAVFAWIGKPPYIQYVFQAVILITGIALVGETLYRTAAPADSITDFVNNVSERQIPIQVLVALYIIWYCNRAPAQAFYRQEPAKTWKEIMEEEEQ
jgi:hypothetical protein